MNISIMNNSNIYLRNASIIKEVKVSPSVFDLFVSLLFSESVHRKSRTFSLAITCSAFYRFYGMQICFLLSWTVT